MTPLTPPALAVSVAAGAAPEAAGAGAEVADGVSADFPPPPPQATSAARAQQRTASNQSRFLFIPKTSLSVRASKSKMGKRCAGWEVRPPHYRTVARGG